ncbi:MAG: DNA replication ATPase [Alphaproteobacteria bacterium]|nr:DNA replication ATPase [Alphaproteobacteria bacterium]
MTPGPTGGGQLLLAFPRIDPAQRPLIESGPYASAIAAMRRWRSWPDGQLAITGEAFAGKTRILNLWAAEAGAAIATGEALAQADMAEIASLSVSALAIDDVDLSANGAGLLSALNLCRDRRAPLLLAGRGPPGGWSAQPPDLCSRLRAMPVAEIGPPDDETLALRLEEECARRHLTLPAESIAYLSQRMERSWKAVGLVADQIEGTPGRGFTLRSARAVLAALGLNEP